MSPVSHVSSMLACGNIDGRLGYSSFPPFLSNFQFDFWFSSFIPVRHIWSMEMNPGMSIFQMRSSALRKLSNFMTSSSKYAVLASKSRLHIYDVNSTLKVFLFFLSFPPFCFMCFTSFIVASSKIDCVGNCIIIAAVDRFVVPCGTCGWNLFTV